uniref:Uncharacterized protein n=1 Tax=viral metagenome TaxID=1070528 RepID=A0A6C0EFP5_9ZZZZ
MNGKKPPDKYRTIKCSLKSIVKNELNQTKLFDACYRTHQIVIHTYQFLRLWILNKYHNKENIPLITDDTIKMAFKSLLKDSQGPKPKGTNLSLYNEFKKLYDDEYKKLNYKVKLDGVNLSQILGYMSIDMLTNIENNIKLHFIKYLNRFVNSSYKKQNNELLEKCEKGTKTILRKQLNKDLYEIKQDLINNTLNSNIKYHEWINKHKNNIFPKEFNTSYEFDIQNNPQNYIKGMIYMCLEIEKIGTKSFQFFPLRNNIILKFIPIDSKSLIELFIEEDKNTYLTDIENKKQELWNKYFNLKNPVFKQKEYSFDYRISTDCFSVSIQLIDNDFIQKEKDKKQNMKNKKGQMKEMTKNMNQEQKEKYKEDLIKKKKDEQVKIKLEKKILKDKEKEAYKKLSKEEKIKLKKQKNTENKNKLTKYIEFPYLEELNETQYNDFKKGNWVVCDPGKRTLMYMKNKDGITYKYTNRMHMNKTKRLKYQRLIKNYKDIKEITPIENKLSDFNSKSCILDEFKKFIKNKNELNKVLLQKYKEDIFRKYKWYAYINRKKAETDLARNIKDKFGKDVILIHGDWSDKLKTTPSRIKYISTPNLGLKRKLNEYLTIYNLDEFRTSCLNYKTEERCENMYLPDKKGVERKIHSILTYQTESKRMGCINRDENAVNNMIKIVNTYLLNKTRPEKFRRDYKFPDKIKDGNPIISINNSVKCH